MRVRSGHPAELRIETHRKRMQSPAPSAPSRRSPAKIEEQLLDLENEF